WPGTVHHWFARTTVIVDEPAGRTVSAPPGETVVLVIKLVPSDAIGRRRIAAIPVVRRRCSNRGCRTGDGDAGHDGIVCCDEAAATFGVRAAPNDEAGDLLAAS